MKKNDAEISKTIYNLDNEIITNRLESFIFNKFFIRFTKY